MTEQTSDWRARIGLLHPSPNANLTCEWAGLLPEGVTYHEALMGLATVTRESLLEMKEVAVAEAKKLAYGDMDIILFACTSGSFVGGPGYDENIIKDLEAATGIPATTASTCVLAAFTDLGIKKIALIGPYPQDIFDIEIKFFEEHGINTLYSRALGYSEIKYYMHLHEQPYRFYRLAKEACKSAPDIDAIFITCLCSPARKMINTLERETGKPVISSCSASLYGVLKQLGIREPIEEFGQLGRLL